jgi:glucose-1-phosphate adenylyltransferase
LYRLVDFALSNLVNSELGHIVVLTQSKWHSLNRHVSTNGRMSSLTGDYVAPVPAQQCLGPKWFAGSADETYQSLNLVDDENPAYVVVFGADHVSRMDAAR